MMMPSILGENLFDDFMNDFRFPAFPDVDKELYGKHAKNLMKTDVKETEKGYEVDKTVYSLKVEAGKTATLKVSDTPKVTDTLIELFKIDMETQKDNPQGNASLAGAEFTWKYYAGFYNKDNLPAEATRTWVTKTIAETDSDGTTHYWSYVKKKYKLNTTNFLFLCNC